MTAPPDRVTVAACQIDVPAVRQDPSVLRSTILRAVDRGARLVVLPELTACAGILRTPAEARAVAEPLDGPTVRSLQEASAATGCVVVAGLAEQGDDAVVHNSAVVLDAGRLVGVYRKVHPWGAERDAFDLGDAPPLVVDTSAGRVGVMVCYDLEFPEWVRLAAQDGAEVLAVPANWPLRDTGHRTDPFEVVKARAAAATYRLNVVVADRCGLEQGVDWYGASLVADVDGRLLAGPACADSGSATSMIVLAEVDLAAARTKTLGSHNHALDDRRPDLYA